MVLWAWLDPRAQLVLTAPGGWLVLLDLWDLLDPMERRERRGLQVPLDAEDLELSLALEEN